MEIKLTPQALKHLEEWKKSGNAKVQDKISLLIDAILNDPFKGIGKPEPLKHDLSGKWSRRITQEDGIVYDVQNDCLNIYSLKGHYRKKE